MAFVVIYLCYHILGKENTMKKKVIKKRGRPKKTEQADIIDSVFCTTKKDTVQTMAPKKRGRPKKTGDEKNGEKQIVTKKRGRPKKDGNKKRKKPIPVKDWFKTLNKKCLECTKSCKQSIVATIIRCPSYEKDRSAA
jgi:hypothetical protein